MSPILSERSVLLVEDNPGDARLIAESLRDAERAIHLLTASTLADALQVLGSEHVDAVVLDLGLPDSDGIGTFVRIREAFPRVATVVMSGNSDTRVALEVVQQGAQDFLVKGRADGDALQRSIEYAIAREEGDWLLRESEERVIRSQQELLASNERLEAMIREVAEVMGSIIETRDPYTQGHQLRVTHIARAIAAEMGLSDDERDCIDMAALLHDIGKLGVPAEILSKPGKLSDTEFALIRQHSAQGAEILGRITFPWPISEIVMQHHERCDGTGYPAGLTCDEIRIEARIIAVADVLEAMSSFRPYRAALGPEAAIAEIVAGTTRYDPDVVAAALALHERGELEL